MAGTIKGGKAFSLNVDMTPFVAEIANLKLANTQGPFLKRSSKHEI